MKKLLAATLLAASFATPAFSADMAVKAPVMVSPAYNWTGFYVGVNGGGEWGRTDPTLAISNNTPGYFAAGNISTVQNAGSTRFNNSGGLAGIQLGYTALSGQAIWGVEASMDWMGARGSSAVTAVYPANVPDTFTLSRTFKTSWLAMLTGRIGYNAGSWSPYATLGIAAAGVKFTDTFTDPVFAIGCTTCVASQSKAMLGAVVGAGAEWFIGSNWSMRAEYLHIWFDSGNSIIGTISSGVGVPTGSATMAHDVSFDENIGRVAFSYHFGNSAVAAKY